MEEMVWIGKWGPVNVVGMNVFEDRMLAQIRYERTLGIKTLGSSGGPISRGKLGCCPSLNRLGCRTKELAAGRRSLFIGPVGGVPATLQSPSTEPRLRAALIGRALSAVQTSAEECPG